MSFTLPMKYPARLENGEIVDANGDRQFLDQKRIAEVINELHEWRMGMKTMPSAIESSSVGELTAKVLANGDLYDGLQHFRNGNWATSVLIEHILKLALTSDDIHDEGQKP